MEYAELYFKIKLYGEAVLLSIVIIVVLVKVFRRDKS